MTHTERAVRVLPQRWPTQRLAPSVLTPLCSSLLLGERWASAPPGTPEPLSALLSCAMPAAEEGAAPHSPPQKATLLLTATLQHTHSPGDRAPYDALSFSPPSGQPQAAGSPSSVSAAPSPSAALPPSPTGLAPGLSSPPARPCSIRAEAMGPHGGTCGRAVTPALSSDRSTGLKNPSPASRLMPMRY